MTGGFSGDRRRERVRWHCRRGMLELDLVLEKVFERHYDRFTDAERDAFERLLALEDTTLLAYVQGIETPIDSGMMRLLALLRE